MEHKSKKNNKYKFSRIRINNKKLNKMNMILIKKLKLINNNSNKSL